MAGLCSSALLMFCRSSNLYSRGRIMKRSKTLLAVLLALPLALLFVSSSVKAQKGDADDGKDVYKKKCQSCHGPNGEKTTYKDVTFPPLTTQKVEAEKTADLWRD